MSEGGARRGEEEVTEAVGGRLVVKVGVSDYSKPTKFENSPSTLRWRCCAAARCNKL